MALMVLISPDIEKVNTDNVVSMISMSDYESEVGNEELNVPDLKDNLYILPKKRLSAMVLSLIIQIEKLSVDNEELFIDFLTVKFECHNLELHTSKLKRKK